MRRVWFLLVMLVLMGIMCNRSLITETHVYSWNVSVCMFMQDHVLITARSKGESVWYRNISRNYILIDHMLLSVVLHHWKKDCLLSGIVPRRFYDICA